MAHKLLSYKDQVQSYRMLACKELREHVFSLNRGSCTSSSSSNKESSSTVKEEATETFLTQATNDSSKHDHERVERLLLRLSSLKKMNTSIIEELFFNDVIQNVQIDSLIPSIIGSDIDSSLAAEID